MNTTPATLDTARPALARALPLTLTDAAVAAWCASVALALAGAAAEGVDAALYGSTEQRAPAGLDTTTRDTLARLARLAGDLRAMARRADLDGAATVAGELAALAAGLAAALAGRGALDDAGEDLSAVLSAVALAGAGLVRALASPRRRGVAAALLRAHGALLAPLGGRGVAPSTVEALRAEVSQ